MIQHLAAEMDGNRRWAKKHGLTFVEGYQEGFAAIKRTIEFCLSHSISYLSLYTFSLENFKRPLIEQEFLFGAIICYGQEHLAAFIEKGVRIRFVGDRERFPARVRAVCERLEKETAEMTALQVQFLFCYGARQEILSVVQQIAYKVQQGQLLPEQITKDDLEQHLWTAGIPDPDIIIRTGGVQRLSNFLLYQAAYTEFYFFECFWPEITETHLQKAVDAALKVERNFGG